MARKEVNRFLEDRLQQAQDYIQDISKAGAQEDISAHRRKKLDSGLGELISQVGDLQRDLDPAFDPLSYFDPSAPVNMGMFIAVALIAQDRVPLGALGAFYGSGVYALYFKGGFKPYAALRASESPIYVGKADPGKDAARSPREQGDQLFRRLREHAKNIDKAENLSGEDFDFKYLVVKSGWQSVAENFLIQAFKPVWNRETKICYGFGKHGDSPVTRKNLRSPWDTLHPGRDWAWRAEEMDDAKPESEIRRELKAHFTNFPPFDRPDTLFLSVLKNLKQPQSLDDL